MFIIPVIIYYDIFVREKVKYPDSIENWNVGVFGVGDCNSLVKFQQFKIAALGRRTSFVNSQL